MRNLQACLIGLVAALLWPAAAVPAEPVDPELVLAVDVSGSVDFVEARLQRDGYVAAFADPAILNAVRSGALGRVAVTYFEWSGFGQTIQTVDWTLIESPGDALAFAAELDEAPLVRGRFTSISGAIGLGSKLFEGNGFEGVRRVIDISGDGPNNTGPRVAYVRDDAVGQDITINGLPIINDRPQPFGVPQIADLDLYFEICVIGGPGAFIVVAEDFNDFAAAIRRKLILEIAGIDSGGVEAPPVRLARAPNVAGAYAGLIPVAGFEPPGCTIGEQLLEKYRLNGERRLDRYQQLPGFAAP